ncbi:DUF3087 domain-containing protein [Shewanella maritima]|uniref:DUF3087 domain-containing protein n=1 Tax=Shewanella maritima TaxID=2520507 RepID=A0A411PGJ0_9GAMM|nr:DUF3087 family protein [Shewanella maritima]QBF82673.1 DUF3087 domain-containing protein [Shewanella maritima]
MKLAVINKKQYRMMNNRVQLGLVAILAILSVVFGQVLIAFWGAEAMPDGSTGNFNLNLLGVILAVMVCTVLVRVNRNKPLFFEVYYVWQVKQLQNKIFKKLAAIQSAAKDDNQDALIILLFYYQSLAMVYELDDNTLTMSKVNAELEQVQNQIDSLNLGITADDFDESLLGKF